MNNERQSDRYCKAFFKVLLVDEMRGDYFSYIEDGRTWVPDPCTNFAEKLYQFKFKFSSLLFNTVSDEVIKNIINKLNLEVEYLEANPTTEEYMRCNIFVLKDFLYKSICYDWCYYDADYKLPKIIKKIPISLFDKLLQLQDSQADHYLNNIVNLLFELNIRNKIINLDYSETEFDYSNIEYSEANVNILLDLYDNLTKLEILEPKEIKLSKQKIIEDKREVYKCEINISRLNNLLKLIEPEKENLFYQCRGDLKAQIALLYRLVKHDFDFCKKSNFNKIYQKNDWEYYENKYNAYGLIDFSKSPQGRFILKYINNTISKHSMDLFVELSIKRKI